jgi:hypothetical protein
MHIHGEDPYCLHGPFVEFRFSTFEKQILPLAPTASSHLHTHFNSRCCPLSVVSVLGVAVCNRFVNKNLYGRTFISYKFSTVWV